ncbi:MAG: C40 family peptidase, partial [Bacilli bacterium]|nr:C40 family peptidase [Bacilli bacterium]
ATAGVAMQTVLAQKYKIKLPYWWGGKSWEYGADKSWGIYKTKYSDTYDVWYYYYGLDCSGFTTWAYVNAGYDINRGQYPWFWSFDKYALKKDNGDVGDFIVSDGHVKLIVGKTDTGFICAEAAGKGPGMCLSNHSYSKTSGYWIAKGESIAKKYPKDSISNIPTGI